MGKVTVIATHSHHGMLHLMTACDLLNYIRTYISQAWSHVSLNCCLASELPVPTVITWELTCIQWCTKHFILERSDFGFFFSWQWPIPAFLRWFMNYPEWEMITNVCISPFCLNQPIWGISFQMLSITITYPWIKCSHISNILCIIYIRTCVIGNPRIHTVYLLPAVLKCV